MTVNKNRETTSCDRKAEVSDTIGPSADRLAALRQMDGILCLYGLSWSSRGHLFVRCEFQRKHGGDHAFYDFGYCSHSHSTRSLAYVALQRRMGLRPRWHRWSDIGYCNHPGVAWANIVIVRLTERDRSASRNWPGHPDRQQVSSRPVVHGRDPRANCYSSARDCDQPSTSNTRSVRSAHRRLAVNIAQYLFLSYAVATTLLAGIRSGKARSLP